MEYWSIGVLGNEIVGLHSIGIGRRSESRLTLLLIFSAPNNS
jgi:hypothetical protein